MSDLLVVSSPEALSSVNKEAFQLKEVDGYAFTTSIASYPFLLYGRPFGDVMQSSCSVDVFVGSSAPSYRVMLNCLLLNVSASATKAYVQTRFSTAYLTTQCHAEQPHYDGRNNLRNPLQVASRVMVKKACHMLGARGPPLPGPGQRGIPHRYQHLVEQFLPTF